MEESFANSYFGGIKLFNEFTGTVSRYTIDAFLSSHSSKYAKDGVCPCDEIELVDGNNNSDDGDPDDTNSGSGGDSTNDDNTGPGSGPGGTGGGSGSSETENDPSSCDTVIIVIPCSCVGHTDPALCNCEANGGSGVSYIITTINCSENKSFRKTGCTPNPNCPDPDGGVGVNTDDDCDTSKDDLKKIFPNASDADMSTLANIINKYGKDFGIDSDENLWHFLSQAGHETGGFNTLNVTESTYWTTATKLAKTYSKFTMDSIQASTNDDLYYAPDYLRNSSGVANIAMCCSYGNGDVASEDGYKYRGRGIFQLTWKDNYTAFKTWYNNKYDPDIDPVTTPGILASNDTLAVLSGLWYYKTRVVDKITIDSTTTVKTVTKPINSARKGLSDRKARFQKAKDSINCL